MPRVSRNARASACVAPTTMSEGTNITNKVVKTICAGSASWCAPHGGRFEIVRPAEKSEQGGDGRNTEDERRNRGRNRARGNRRAHLHGAVVGDSRQFRPGRKLGLLARVLRRDDLAAGILRVEEAAEHSHQNRQYRGREQRPWRGFHQHDAEAVRDHVADRRREAAHDPVDAAPMQPERTQARVSKIEQPAVEAEASCEDDQRPVRDRQRTVRCRWRDAVRHQHGVDDCERKQREKEGTRRIADHRHAGSPMLIFAERGLRAVSNFHQIR